MRRLVLACLCWWGAAVAVQAEGITEVLQRSQQMRLAQRGSAELHGAAAQRVRDSFERLLAHSGSAALRGTELRLVGGGLFAEAVFGQRAVVVSESVGELPEGERLLMLAHELGHLRLGHWGALSRLYLQHIPGEVRPETTDPVAGTLGPQAHALSHQQEFEADAFGFALVRPLGFSLDTALALLTRQGLQFDSATHPATRRRLAQLRLLETQLANAPLMAGEVATSVAASPTALPRAAGSR